MKPDIVIGGVTYTPKHEISVKQGLEINSLIVGNGLDITQDCVITIKDIYRVYTQGDKEGKTTKNLGYAIGDPTDIKIYFDDKKFYSIELQKIKTLVISAEDVLKKSELMLQKHELEKKLKEINKMLENE